MKQLSFAEGLVLPIDVVTQKAAFMGRTGSGKTYAATKLAELLLRAGAQVVAIDPVGVWWGLRLNADGKTPSDLELPIFGGLHGDIPLESTGGRLMADLVVDRALSCVLDVSQFESDAEKARFVRDFADRFFFRKKAAPSAVHLFLEEAQEFVPQNPTGEDAKMLHVLNRLIKLGRNFGIGVSLVSQRPQEVNKKALNQTELLLAFQMTGPQERKAISAWVSEKGADEDVSDILPRLKIGQPHVWSPQWLGVSKTVQVNEKLTYNASSTPTFGAKAVESKPLGAIDLSKLQERMAATIEKAKAEDPKHLRAEVARLKREIDSAGKKNGQTATKPVIDQSAIDKAVTRAIAADRKRLRPALDRLQRLVTPLLSILDAVGAIAQILNEENVATPGALLAPKEHRLNPSSPVVSLSGSKPEGRAGGHAGRDSRERLAPPSGDGSVSRSMQKISRRARRLRAARDLAGETSQRRILRWLTPRTATSTIWWASCAQTAYLDYPGGGTIQLTDAGRAIANAAASEIQTLEDLHQVWLRKLSPSEGKLLGVLIARYPDPISRGELAEQTGYTENGHFNNMVGHLRTLGAADYPGGGQVVATDVLFPEGLA